MAPPNKAIAGSKPAVVAPPPPPLTEDQKQVLTEDHKSPAPSAPPPDDAQLKKITSDVSSMGVKLPADMLDDKGNIKPDKLAAAKDFIKAEADKRKGTDVGAAARLLKRAVALDPKDEKLRLETAKTWLEWGQQSKATKDARVLKVQLEEAYGFIADIDTKGKANPEFTQAKHQIAWELSRVTFSYYSSEAASKWLGIAVQNATPEQAQTILKGLLEHPHPEICGKNGDPYEFVADNIFASLRVDEGLAVLKQGAQENKDPEAKAKNLRDYHIYDQIFHPYQTSFDDSSNPFVKQLYDALKKHNVPDAAFKGGAGKAERPAEDKVWTGEVLQYVSEHFDSKEVQAALKDAKIEVPASVRREIKEKGFGKAMADYHAAEAKKLARSDKPEDKQMCAAHLKIAVACDGDNTELRLKYGQALMRDEKFAEAAKEFEQVRRQQPMNATVLLDIAKAQIGAGEPKKALDALELYDNSLGAIKTDRTFAEVNSLRSKAGSMRLADLLKQYDGLKGGGTRDERLRLLDEMAECPKSTNMERFEVLKRRRDYYAAEVKRPDADSFDKRHAQEDLDRIDKQIETLRDDLKQAAQVKKGETPSREQLDAAKTAGLISQSYGDLSDLLHYNELVHAATSDVMDAKAKLDAHGEVFRALRAQGGRTSESDAVGQQIQELAQDYLKSGKAKDYLEHVIQAGHGPVLDLLSADGLKKIETEVDAANQALAEAGKKTDVKEKRGCLIEALKHFGAVGDNAKAREVANQIEATIPADMPRADKLQIYGLMAGVMKDSKLTAEDGKNYPITKEYVDKGTELATEIIGRGNMGPPHGAERVKELLVAKAFCDAVGDIPNAHTATLRLDGIRGELLADPMFTDPQQASDPAKAKERLETARLVVQIDLELMGSKLNNAAKIVQEISEGKRPASDRDLLNSEFKDIADHIGIWQDQLALAKDLPVNERLAEGSKIAASLGRLKILTEGDKPLLKKDDLSAVSTKFETTMGAIFADCMEQGPQATAEDKKMAADIVSDMKSRLKSDIEDGNMIWASQLDSKKLIQFAETAQNARKLMDEAKAKGPLDPVGAQRYLQAAALYAQIGCKERVKEAMHPVEVFETGIANPSDRITLEFSIAQIYTMAGMTKEANSILWRAAEMDTPEFPSNVREMAGLAKGMRYLNDGDTDKARAELEKLPDNKTAQELLRGITAGGRELRINQAMQVARSWLFSLEGKNMAPGMQAAMEQGIDDVLHKAKTLMMEGKAANFRDALEKANREAPGAVQAYIQSNLISTGNDSLPNDPQGKIMAAITVMADPNVSDKDAAEAAIKLSDALILAGERYYGNAGQIAQFMVDNPYVGKDAKKIIDEKIPEWVKMGAIFSGLKGLACATPVGAFCMIFFAGSEAEANEAMVNSLISIGSFGIARGLAVGAEALWVAKMATVIESPVIMGATKFGVRTVTEAAAFPVAGALLTTAFTGKVDHWQPEHFKKEFLSMLVTFTLLHGAGIPLSKFTGRAERSVLEAQEALKLARQAGKGVEAAESALNRAMAFEKMAKGVGWMGNVAAFTGAEYVNESLGLKPEEKGVPFWMKFLGCAVTDAQMKAGGKIIDGVTNGKLTRIEMNTAKIMQVHGELPKFNSAVGVGQTSAPVMKAIQARIEGDTKFDPAKFLTDAQGVMKTLEPALKDVPKDKQEQVRQALLLEIAEGKLDGKLAQTLAKRVKAQQSEIVPNESGTGYDLVPGKKSVEGKKKEDQRYADAQQKAAQKRVDDAKKKREDEAVQQAFQTREKGRVAEFDKGFGFRERTEKGSTGIEKYDTKTGKAADKVDYTTEDLKSFQDYQKKQEAKKELRSNFETGQRVLPDPGAKGKFQLVDAKGERVREASREELGEYLKFKTDTKAFQAAEKLRTEAIEKAKGERIAGLETQFADGAVVQVKMKKTNRGMVPDGIELVGRDGGTREVSTFELDAYKGWQTKKAQAQAKAEAETKLKQGFAEGQEILLNADTGNFELVDAKGKTLRVASDEEHTLFSQFEVEKQKHQEHIEKRAQELAPDFENKDHPVVIRPKQKDPNAFKEVSINDPNIDQNLVRAVQDGKGKVHYLVKLDAEGKPVKATLQEAQDFLAPPTGFEKVVDGKVLPDPVPKDDYEAFGVWQKNKLKGDALAKSEAADQGGAKVLPFPGQKGEGYLSEAALREARQQAVDHAYDELAAKGPVSAEELLKRTQAAVDSLRALEPSLGKLSADERSQVQEGILRQVTEGKMSREEAFALAEKISTGEATLVPSAKGEYGYEVKINPKGREPGVASFRSITDVEAQAAKIEKAKPSAERIARYEQYLIEVKHYDPAEAKKAAQEWASKVITDARAHQAGRTHIYDTSLPMKPENAHLDTATIDHHGRFANKKNSTEQLIDRMDATLEAVKGDKAALEAAKKDKPLMDAARQGFVEAGVKAPSEEQVAQVAAAMREMNLREVTTDNLADGAWSVWIAKHQARVLADPALRKLVTDATHFEDFTAFGSTYDKTDPAVRMQAALFQKYGDILQRNGIVGSDRFPPDKAQQVMGDALTAIDQMVADPKLREAAASEFFTKVEEARKVVLEQGVMKGPTVTEGDTQLIFVDLTKLGKFTVFQQWLAIPQAEVVPGKPHTMQVSVVPLGKAKLADGTVVDAPRSLQIVAIPDGRSLPSGKTMLDAVSRVNAAELAKAEELGLVPKEGETPKPGQYSREEYSKVWFGKENVILPNPAKGSLLSPKEVSDILTDRAPGSKDAPLKMFEPKADPANSIQGAVDALLPADPNATRIAKKPTPPPSDNDTRITGPQGKASDGELQPSEIDRTPADAPGAKGGKKLSPEDQQFTSDILPSALYRGVYRGAADIQSKGELVQTLEAWVMGPEGPKTPAARKQFIADLMKGHNGEPGGKVLLILDGEVHVETPERAKARLEWRDEMLGALGPTTQQPAKALKEWLQTADAPKTFEERQQFLAELQRGAQGDLKGKVMLVDGGGKVHVETLGDVKARIEAGKEFLTEYSKTHPDMPREVQEALLWRAALAPGKKAADVKEDLNYAMETYPKVAEEAKGLPKELVADLGVRFLRGDIRFYDTKQFAASYREARANAEKLGITGEKFDGMVMSGAKQWQTSFEKHPSEAVQASMKNLAPILDVLGQTAPFMTEANRAATMQRVLDGKITLDQAYEVMTAQTLGSTLDGVETALKPAQVKQLYRRALEGVYKPTVPPHIKATLENYLASKDPMAMLEEGFARTAFNLQIPPDRYQKFAENLKGLDPQSQAALLIHLELQMEKLFGPVSTSGGITAADRSNAEGLFRATEDLAKQMRDLDPPARSKLAAELITGKRSLEDAIMAADRPTLPPPPGADDQGTRVEKLPTPDADLTPTVAPGVPKPKVGDYKLPDVFEANADLKKEVVFLAAGKSPFAEAAKQVIEGKIKSVDEYRAAQRKVGQDMVAAHQPAFAEAKAYLDELAKDPSLHLSKEFPPVGRMKSPDDLGPKLVRRGWEDSTPLTDVAGTRIVVRSNADAEAVIARLQAKYPVREVYSKEGDIETTEMGPESKKAHGVEDESNVVWLRAKLDKDDIHRLVAGHPASGYRALHVVIEVNGKPVEVQIKTEAMHEWGEIEHKLVYKNQDVPAAIMDPIKEYRRQVADYLAKAGEGQDPGARPKPPELPADAPKRADLEAGIKGMEALMDKYGPPPSQGKVLPFKGKAPDAKGADSKPALKEAADASGEGFGAKIVKSHGDSKATDALLKPYDGMVDKIRGGDEKLADRLKADLATLRSGDPASPEYKAALGRVNEVEGSLKVLGGPDKVTASELTDTVRKVYDKPVDKPDEGGGITPGDLSGPAAVLLGLATLFAPDVAQAAEGPMKDVASRGGIGMTEAVVILGIGTLFGLPFVAKYLKARGGGGKDAAPITRDAPLKISQEGKTSELYPHSKDAKLGENERPGRFNKKDSSVVGDQVYLSMDFIPEAGKAADPKADKGSLVPMSKAEAERLGVKFDKKGEIVKVPDGVFVLKVPKAAEPPPIDVVADSGPAPKGKAVVTDKYGRPVSELQPLTVSDEKPGSNLQTFGKILSAEPLADNPKKVVLTVETYSPSDPLADPTSLAFGIGKQPKVIERRQVVVDRETAVKEFGLVESPDKTLKMPNNPYVSINDEAGIANPSSPVVVRVSSTHGKVLYPADQAGKKQFAGHQIWVDPKQVSYMDGQFTVFYEKGNFATGKVEKVMEPVVLTMDQARRLGITLDHEGNIVHGKGDKDGKLSFILSDIEVGKDEKITVDGKPLDADNAPVSVKIVADKGGLRLVSGDGKEIDPPAPQGAMLSGTVAARSKLVAAAKAAGPLGVALLALLSPETAHAASVENVQRVAETMGLGSFGIAAGVGLMGLIGMAFLGGGGGGKPPQPNHPAIVPHDGVTSFGIGIDSAGRPVMNGIGPSAMTFERGPGGQWYYFEGQPPKTRSASMDDPQSLAGWKPVRDGDVYGISDAYGRQWVIPFKAPKDGWIPGYAPTAASDGIIPAVSGQLPVGKVSMVVMKEDGSPFVIGRGPGDLQFTDSSVSGVHATIWRDPQTGQHYLIDGAAGDPKKSTNGVVYGGVKMNDLPPQYRKAVPIQPGDYFAINGAYFQFQPSPVTPVKAMDHPMGFAALRVGNQDFSMRLTKMSDTMLFGPDTVQGSIQRVYRYPNDPEGRMSVTLKTYRPSNPQGGESKLVVELTAAQAEAMGLKLSSDGKLDPTMRDKLVTFNAVPAQPQVRVQPQPQPMADAAYAQPAPGQPGLVVKSRFANQDFALQTYRQGMPWDPAKDLGGEILGVLPHPDKSGRYVVSVGYREGNDTQAPLKTMAFNMEPAEVAALGVRMDATGKLLPGQRYFVKVSPDAAPAPKPALVSIDPATGLPRGVYGALGDNVPGQTPRRGELRGKLPSGSYAVRTHEGMGKDYNEDGFVQGKDFAVVIDEVGTGGSHGQASKIFGQAVSKYIEAHRGTADPKKVLTEAFRAGNDAINASPYKRSSVVAVAQMVVKQPDGSYKAYIIHRGDARAMVVDKEGKILHVTKDESMVELTHGEAKEPGEYETELKKRADPGGNVVLGALGGGHNFDAKITVTEMDLPPGARIVLASDGVTDSVSSKELAGVVTKTDDMGKAMDEGFQLGLTKMSEGLDASEMLRFQNNLKKIEAGGKLRVVVPGKVIQPEQVIQTDRVPFVTGNTPRYIQRKYNQATDEYTYTVYDSPEGGKQLETYTRKGKDLERLPVTTSDGQNLYVDPQGNLWHKPVGNEPVMVPGVQDNTVVQGKFQINQELKVRVLTGFADVERGGTINVTVPAQVQEERVVESDRVPLVTGGETRYVNRKYDKTKDEYTYTVYDAPVGGNQVDTYTRKGKVPERIPVTTPEGEHRYMDGDYNLWDKPTGGKMLDHYKPSDNITLHVYMHDPDGKAPPPSGDKGEGGGPPPPKPPLPKSKPLSPPPPFTVGGQKKI